MALTASGLWTRSYIGNRDQARIVTAEIQKFRTAAADIPGNPIGDTDLPPVARALSILRDIPVNPVDGVVPPPDALGWGLYQGRDIGNEVKLSYRAALNHMLLPRLMLRLEEQMQSNMNNADLLYEALKIYLMLGQVGPMNADLVREWMTVDWSLAYPGPEREEMRTALEQHLDALLSQPMDKIETNGDLVKPVREFLTEMPQAQRVYNGIINSPAASGLPKWRLTDVGGPNLTRAIVRSSGTQLNDGVPGIYTYAGFNDVFLSEALGVAKRISADSWVLGPEGQTDSSEKALLNLSRDVLDLYYTDFISVYDKLLGDVDIIPMQNLAHAVEVTGVLSGPTSPIVNILTGIAKETNLIAVPDDAVDTAGVEAGGGAVGSLLVRRKLSPAALIFLDAMSAAESADGNGPPPPPGAYVTDEFSWLHALVAREEGQPSQLDGLMATLKDVNKELNGLAGDSSFGGAPQGDSTALARFQQLAKGLPGPMERWATQIAAGSGGLAAGNTRASIDALWQARVAPVCIPATKAYPFDRRAPNNISIQDFSRLFAPAPVGLIDTFFKENLAKLVDIRTNPWTWKDVNDTDLGISDGVLKQMQNAAMIRDAFFAGNSTPSVKFQITPNALDTSAEMVILEIDGQQIGFQQRSGEPRPSAITWPGPVGSARIDYIPPVQGGQNTLSFDGPWAWFRMLQAASIRDRAESDRKLLIFTLSGRKALFVMQSSSINDPFFLAALDDFQCPKSF